MVEETLPHTPNSLAVVIAALPYSPSTTTGRGLLPGLARTTGHLLYILGRTTDTPTRRPTENQLREEFNSVNEHLTEFVIPEYLSTEAKEQLGLFVTGVNIITSDFISWDEESRVNNLRGFCNRIVQLHAFLDREILGIRNSDAGLSL